jgi:hypothetical protein
MKKLLLFLMITSTGFAGYNPPSSGGGETQIEEATPGGSTTYVQFNDAGTFGGDPGLIFNKTTNSLTVAGNQAVGGSLEVIGSITVSGQVNTAGVNTVLESGNTGYVRMYEDPASSGANYTGFKAPTELTGNTQYEMPNGYPASTGFWKSSDAGVVSFDTAIYATGISAGSPKIFNIPKTITDPHTVYGVDPNVGLLPKTQRAFHVKKVNITLDADPTTETQITFKYADAFIGKASAATLATIATAVGVYSDETENWAVPAGKTLYAVFAADPDVATTQAIIDLECEND